MKNYEIDIGKLFVNNFVCFDLIAKEISLIYDVQTSLRRSLGLFREFLIRITLSGQNTFARRVYGFTKIV